MGLGFLLVKMLCARKLRSIPENFALYLKTLLGKSNVKTRAKSEAVLDCNHLRGAGAAAWSDFFTITNCVYMDVTFIRNSA